MDDREILRPLTERILELSARPGEDVKKELWARHNALQRTSRIPVCVSFEGIPGPQWDLMFGSNHLACSGDLARRIEFDLRKRVWMAENVPDDHVVWAAVLLPAVPAGKPDWGVPVEWHHSGDDLGAKGYDPPFAAGIDLARLRPARTEVDEAATAARLEQAAELLGGRLAVHPRYETLGEGPFDTAVQFRGMENIFLDVFDSPEQVHALMAFITDAILADHRNREARGWINSPPDPSGRYQMIPMMRHIAGFLPPDFAGRRPRLSDEWPYVTAQTSSGLGPDQYAEFVGRYNARIAEFYTRGTVYYHGCECLDQKLGAISGLPNLRRHHVSPWSSVRAAAEHYRGSVVLEVHAHPGKVFFGASREDMRAELDGLLAAAAGHPLNLNLSDIHSVNGDPTTLRTWAEEARQAAEA
ncbi:MAG TPA: hypothetical protein PK280_18795 [Planctomycetota bacterium]|nr:hypothetical protein [Planctomycetota bacterium]